MANVKISALPAATTPLTGTEEVALVQTGTTVRATISDINGITLQQVLTNGRSLTNGNNFQGTGAGAGNSGNNVNAFGTNAGASNTYNNVTLLGNGATASFDDQLVFVNGAGKNLRITNTNSITDNTLNVPDNNGTIVLSVNGQGPNSGTGDVTVPFTAYKEYVGYFGQFAFGDPSVQIVNNTLSGPIVWTRIAQGDYQGVLVGAFPAAKTFIQQNIQYFQGFLYTNAKLEFFRQDDNTILVQCRNITTGVAQDVYLGNIPLQIRVYP